MTLNRVETAAMSDESQGPGWWLASDGSWHPPELHPSIQAEAAEIAQSRAAHPSSFRIPTLVTEPTYAAETDLDPVSTVEIPRPGSDEPSAAAKALGVPTPGLPAMAGAPRRPAWTTDSDRRPESGPMYPDLFSQAVAGSRLAETVTVNFADGEHRDTLDVPSNTRRPGDPRVLVSASSRTPTEVGTFSGASAKKRWRRHH